MRNSSVAADVNVIVNALTYISLVWYMFLNHVCTAIRYIIHIMHIIHILHIIEILRSDSRHIFTRTDVLPQDLVFSVLAVKKIIQTITNKRIAETLPGIQSLKSYTVILLLRFKTRLDCADWIKLE